MTALEALFPRTRRAILATLYRDTERNWFLSDLAANLGVTPSSLQRELARLVSAGILTRRLDGRRTYYRPDTTNPLSRDLASLISRTVGIVPTIREILHPFRDTIEFSFVYGSVARDQLESHSDVDIMVIGSARLSQLSPALRQAEERLGRPVNSSVYTRSEFSRKLTAGSHFLTTVMKTPRVFIEGTDDELARALGKPTS